MYIQEDFIPIYTLTLDEDELEALELAVGLMLENEHTHEMWHEILGPVHALLLQYADPYNTETI